MSADELVDLINEEPRIEVIDSYDPGEAEAGGEVDQQQDPHPSRPLPSQLMPPPPFMPRPQTDRECMYCSSGFRQGFAEQYWEDHLRQQADRGAGSLPDDLPGPSTKTTKAVSIEEETNQDLTARNTIEGPPVGLERQPDVPASKNSKAVTFAQDGGDQEGATTGDGTPGRAGPTRRGRTIREMSLGELGFNPGSPVPTPAQTVARICELWPLWYTVYGSLRKLWEKQKRRSMIEDAVWADSTELCVEGIDEGVPNAVRRVDMNHVSDLIVAIIMEGTTPWKGQAYMLGEVLASEGLTESESGRIWTPDGKVNPLYTEEGVAVYWMWMAEEHIQLDEIVEWACWAALQEKQSEDPEWAPVLNYHPYVLRPGFSEGLAMDLVQNIMACSDEMGLRKMKMALAERYEGGRAPTVWREASGGGTLPNWGGRRMSGK